MSNENNRYLRDVKVRRAIGMAIDVDRIIRDVFMGDARRENGIIPTGVPAHNDAMEGFTYDPEGAKALLLDAGYTDGEIRFELAMDAAASPGMRQVYSLISEYLNNIGIEATVVSYEHSAWLALRSDGEMDAYIGHWIMDYNDPAHIMVPFFGSEEISKSRSLNYSNRAMIARVTAARGIVDEAEREAEYRALDRKLIEEEAVWIPMYTELHLWCLGDRVSSFTPHWAGFSDFYAADVVLKSE